ncbi:hypothetical protein GCM10028812_39820 [Ancylobacter sonchi]
MLDAEIFQPPMRKAEFAGDGLKRLGPNEIVHLAAGDMGNHADMRATSTEARNLSLIDDISRQPTNAIHRKELSRRTSRPVRRSRIKAGASHHRSRGYGLDPAAADRQGLAIA